MGSALPMIELRRQDGGRCWIEAPVRRPTTWHRLGCLQHVAKQVITLPRVSREFAEESLGHPGTAEGATDTPRRGRTGDYRAEWS